jgi:hypothetical protein
MLNKGKYLTNGLIQVIMYIIKPSHVSTTMIKILKNLLIS